MEGNKGFYLLPTAKEVANDLTVQMMSPGGIASMMEVNQYFFGQIDQTLKQSGLKDGFHIDILLRD